MAGYLRNDQTVWNSVRTTEKTLRRPQARTKTKRFPRKQSIVWRFIIQHSHLPRARFMVHQYLKDSLSHTSETPEKYKHVFRRETALIFPETKVKGTLELGPSA